MKNIIHKIHIIILLVFALNVGVFYALGGHFTGIEGMLNVLVLPLILIVDSIVIIALIRYYYEYPILRSKYNIHRFLTGQLKNKDLTFDNTHNSDLNYIVHFISQTLKNLKNIRGEFLHGKEIKSEVDLAKEIQGRLLNKKITTIPSLSIVAKSKPAGEIGGDSYDVINTDNNYYVYVGDATGHGVGAGFIMVMVNALVSGFTKLFETGDKILAHTNEILKPRVKSSTLMTLLMVRWNEKSKKLYMTGAGHEYLMIYKHSKQKCYKIKSGGVALGMTKNVHKLLKEKHINFEENDIIVLYSDGITEAINKPERNGNEKMFGEDGLVKAIETAPNVNYHNYKSAQSVFNNITIELSKFMGYKYKQMDDITLAVLHYRPENFDITKDFSDTISDEFLSEWKWG